MTVKSIYVNRNGLKDILKYWKNVIDFIDDELLLLLLLKCLYYYRPRSIITMLPAYSYYYDGVDSFSVIKENMHVFVIMKDINKEIIKAANVNNGP